MTIQKITEEEILSYIELYDIEKHIFNVVGINAKQRGYLTFPEFFEVCMWKSFRPKKRYVLNKDCVEAITKAAFNEQNEIRRMEILCKLSGVSIPTASALLTVVYPEKYAVIDIRCLEQLNNIGYQISTNISIKIWAQYLELMRKISRAFNITPRQLDMAFFAMHREKLNKENFSNLYNRK